MNVKYRVALSFALSVVLCCSMNMVATSTAQDPGSAAKPAVQEKQAGLSRQLLARTWTKETQIGQIVAERPQTARIFELVDIDYCCGGQTPLGKAAAEKGLKVEKILSALLTVGASTGAKDETNWQEAKLPELLDHIVARHHSWLRRELPQLLETTNDVHQVHGAAHQELTQVAALVQEVHDALLPHLADEENRVFPAVRQLVAGNPPASVADMLEEMRTDHDVIGAKLHDLRKLTDDFAVPDDACVKYREMLTGLQALESDIHMHVHLENNVLLPRSLKMLEPAR